jgi:NADPH:quinone reductase
MKVVRGSRFGGTDVFDVVDEPPPPLRAGQVLVRVRASGVNFADTLMRQNRYAFTPPLPFVLGHEVAGTVERVGDGVRGLTAGMRVAAPLFASGVFLGGYAEIVAIDAAVVVPLPDDVSFETAAALMVQGLTASLLTKQAPPGGKSVLVNAAAGGVGSILVQLCRRAGAASVIAGASSPDKLACARDLGADAGVDYTRVGWVDDLRAATGGRGPDLVYESVGGDVTMESLEALAPLGRLVIYGALNIQRFALGVPELLKMIFRNQTMTGFALAPLLTPESLRNELDELFALSTSGELSVRIGATYPLARAADAHAALEGRRTTGKVLLIA